MRPRYRIIFFLAVLLVFSQNAFSQCGCTHFVSLSGSELTFDGAAKNVKPGDKICFQNGTRTGIQFKNIKGTPEKPVIITNRCDGKVKFQAPSNWGNVIEFLNSSNFVFTGSANPDEEYGIESTGALFGLNMHTFTTDFEVDHVYVNNVGCSGMVAKTDPKCNDTKTQRGGFTLRNISFHHNKIENTGCEGFYIGNSHYDIGVNKECGKIWEHDVDNVEVYNNILINIGNDGIQVGAATNTTVHHNTVIGTGLNNGESHMNGIQMGSGTTQAVVYNNIVDGAHGYGIFDSGGGGVYYNNVVMNSLLPGIFLKDDAPNYAPTGFSIINNTFINNKSNTIYMLSENPSNSYFLNNIFVGPSQGSYSHIYINNPSKIKWQEGNNLQTKDISTVKFVDPGNKDYRLQAGSSAINAGKDVSANGVNFDFDEQPRPSGGIYDVGAFEFQVAGPKADAGPDHTIKLPTDGTTLKGKGTSTSPTGITAYEWSKKSGGIATLKNKDTPDLTVDDLVEGQYVFQLKVTDANGFDFDEAIVNVSPADANENPKADAGKDRSITLPANNLKLEGKGTDADGSIKSYEWTQVSGPSTAKLTNDKTADVTVSDLIVGTYTFQLTVTDDDDATASDQVVVVVEPEGTNQKPTVSTNPEVTVFSPASEVTITATANDPDGTIKSILWEKKSGGTINLSGQGTLELKVIGLALGNYTLRITVTDDDDATAFTEVIVKVLEANQSPTAEAGPDQSLTLPDNSIAIEGTGTDPDGTIVSYQWVKVSGPAATLAGEETADLQVSDMEQGTYVFGLTVTDNDNATGYDEVTIAVSVAQSGPNEPPLAIAGDNASFSLPTNSVNLYGSGFDPDGTIVSYVWTKASGGAATLSNSNTPTLTVTDLQAGQYRFRLTVTDDKGAADEDIAIVTVSALGTNIFPLASAGADKIVRLPQNSVLLNGTGTDVDGQIVSYAWTQVSGPPAIISSPSTTSTTVSNLVEGTYVFRLTVTDDEGATDLNDVTIRVVSSTSNLPPVVNAGADATVFLPQTTLTLNAEASDDGTIESFFWAKLGGPAVTLVNPSELDLQLTNLVEGEYSFQLTVTDNNDASVFDIVKVSVLPASFAPPIVNAGVDQEITLPTNQITLTGAATATSGTIVNTVWTKTVGPDATLSGASTLTLQVTNMAEGTYVFTLTATDDQGKSVSDNVQVIVKPIPPNQAPLVSAGINQSLLLPLASLELQGTATDTDGTVTSVKWTKLQGPDVTLSNDATLNLTITDIVQGAYIFRLSATDNEGAVGSDQVIIVISDPTSTGRKSPIVFAGEDTVITKQENEIIITGTAIDPDGIITSYVWTQESGNPVNFTTNENILHLFDPPVGVYGFRLQVTDDDELSSSDDILISIIDSSNEIPKFFSPNNDGTGDVWTFRNSVQYVGCGVKVFNRAGSEVFSATPYENNWNGIGKNGSPVQDGDYYYILACPDGRQIKGALRVIR